MQNNSNFSHKIYKKDPLLFKSSIGKETNILTEDGTTISGIIYTIDPVSESVVLLQGCQQNNLKIIFGHAIKNIEICSTQLHELPELFTNTPTNILQTSLEERKNAIINLLQKNRFPVKEQNHIITIKDVLSIKPPYEPGDCICTNNSIILRRIQDLLTSV